MQVQGYCTAEGSSCGKLAGGRAGGRQRRRRTSRGSGAATDGLPLVEGALLVAAAKSR
jgi:hypothetical protein